MKLKIYLLLITLCLFACKKKSEDSPSPSPLVVERSVSRFQNVDCFGLLTSHKWLRIKTYFDKPIEIIPSVFVTDIYAYYPCMADDYMIFEKDTAIFYANTAYCNLFQTLPEYQTWKLSTDHSQLIASDTSVNYLEEISDTSLQYYRYPKKYPDTKLTFRYKGVAKQ